MEQRTTSVATAEKPHEEIDPVAANEARCAALWERFKATADPAARERLILHYSPLVKYVAGRVGVGLPPNIEQADLVSYGIFGLIDAIEKFDIERAIKFETYAISRIRGAIIDELRAIDWIPRSVRLQGARGGEGLCGAEGELHRTPTEAEVAAAAGHQRWRTCTRSSARSRSSTWWPSTSCSPSAGRRATSSAWSTRSRTPRPRTRSPAFESEETKFLLARAINQLPEREKIVVTLYYYEGLTLAEIGQVLGVTECRICQMHTKAVLQLRGKLAEVSKD